jgi:hypothetical protein
MDVVEPTNGHTPTVVKMAAVRHSITVAANGVSTTQGTNDEMAGNWADFKFASTRES